MGAGAVTGKPPLAQAIVGMAAMVAGASLAHALVLFCGARAGWMIASVAVGLLFAATYRTWVEAAGLGALSAAMGALCAAAVFTPEALGARLGTFEIFARDALNLTASRFLLGLSEGNVTAWVNPALLVVFSALLAAGVAAGVGLLVRLTRDRKRARTLVAALVVACAISAMWLGARSAALDEQLQSPPPARTYRQDMAIYWHTFVRMTDGQGFYSAFRDSAADDTLLIDNGFVRNGKFVGWVFSPASIRLPYGFYAWRFLAPGGGAELYVAALCFASLLLAMSLWALLPRVGPAAALVPLLLTPYLQVMLAFGGVFMPDVWAGLFVTMGFLAWVRERYAAAAALVLVAALFRETAVFALLILLAWSIVRAVRREPGWRRHALVLAGATAAFALAYWLHLRAGAPYVASSQSSGGTVAMMLRQSAARSFSDKFVAPTAFGAALYGFAYVPTWLPILVQFPGWFLALRGKIDAQVAVLGYAAFWAVFSATLGATSAYWGALYVPLAIAGSAALFAWAGAWGQGAIRAPARG